MEMILYLHIIATGGGKKRGGARRLIEATLQGRGGKRKGGSGWAIHRSTKKRNCAHPSLIKRQNEGKKKVQFIGHCLTRWPVETKGRGGLTGRRCEGGRGDFGCFPFALGGKREYNSFENCSVSCAGGGKKKGGKEKKRFFVAHSISWDGEGISSSNSVNLLILFKKGERRRRK